MWIEAFAYLLIAAGIQCAIVSVQHFIFDLKSGDKWLFQRMYPTEVKFFLISLAVAGIGFWLLYT